MPASPPTPPEDPPVETPAAPQSFDMQLEEFCRRISGEDRRVEMLAAFYADERANGRFKDAEAAYRERFTAFATKPA